jgi:hypothetical protein
MNDEEFARFVNLLHSLGSLGDAAKGQGNRERALSLLKQRLPELSEEQVKALLELEREYVRWFESELRSREEG